MKNGKIFGRIAVGALILSAVPYRIKRDKETGSLEVRSLLWGFKTTPGDEKNRFTFAIPSSGLDYAAPDAGQEQIAD